MRFTAFFYVRIYATSVNVAPHLFFWPFCWWHQTKMMNHLLYTTLVCVCYCHRMMDHSIFDRVTRTLILWALLYNGCLFFPRVIARPWDNNVCTHHGVSPIWACFLLPLLSISISVGGLIIADKLEPPMRRSTPVRKFDLFKLFRKSRQIRPNKMR